MFYFLNTKRKVGNSNRHLFIRISANHPIHKESSTQAIPVLCKNRLRHTKAYFVYSLVPKILIYKFTPSSTF